MPKKIFYIVDVFAETKYAGNQLAVLRDAENIPDGEMQQIAKEMNYSETTFILSDKERDEGYDVRIFTPAEEIPFAGHPTLGTAFVIQQEIIGKKIESLNLNLKVGQIPVSFKYSGDEVDILWMKQKAPTFDREFDKALISKALNLDESSINERFPVQEVSTGLPFIITPLNTLKDVKRARVDKERFFALIEDTAAKSILVFCPETYQESNDLNVRVFVDYFGIPEDPATGSGNGCLAGYLAKHRYFGEDQAQINIRVEQGYEIGRPSLLFLKAENKKEGIDVFVGGKTIMIAKGELI